MLTRFRQRRSQRAAQAALPQVCYLLAGAVHAGLPLDQAVRVAAEEAPLPVRHEFVRVVRLLDMGTPFAEAITVLATEIGGDDVTLLVFALRLAHETGGDLVTALHAVAARMHDVARVRHRIASLTAQGRISAVVIALLPFLMLVIMLRVVPMAVMPLVTTGLGWGCVGAALGLDLLGVWWLQRIVRIPV